MHEYLEAMQEIESQLLEAKIAIPDILLAWSLLIGLPQETTWDSLINSMPIDDQTKFTAEYVTTRLLSEHIRLEERDGGKNSNGITSQNQALFSERPSTIVCYKCGGQGHYKNECPTKDPGGTPKNYRGGRGKGRGISNWRRGNGNKGESQQ